MNSKNAFNFNLKLKLIKNLFKLLCIINILFICLSLKNNNVWAFSKIKPIVIKKNEITEFKDRSKDLNDEEKELIKIMIMLDNEIYEKTNAILEKDKILSILEKCKIIVHSFEYYLSDKSNNTIEKYIDTENKKYKDIQDEIYESNNSIFKKYKDNYKIDFYNLSQQFLRLYEKIELTKFNSDIGNEIFELFNSVSDQYEIKYEINNEIKYEINNEIKYEINSEIKYDMKYDEINKAIKYEINTDDFISIDFEKEDFEKDTDTKTQEMIKILENEIAQSFYSILLFHIKQI
ncbi:hypothetical protein [Candidatus Phytoplasma oryzae]|nr:hypothetical protein PIE28_01090 [Candidatus Phytoplasma oryzae]